MRESKDKEKEQHLETPKYKNKLETLFSDFIKDPQDYKENETLWAKKYKYLSII